jgi:hypothetical protein
VHEKSKNRKVLNNHNIEPETVKDAMVRAAKTYKSVQNAKEEKKFKRWSSWVQVCILKQP